MLIWGCFIVESVFRNCAFKGAAHLWTVGKHGTLRYPLVAPDRGRHLLPKSAHRLAFVIAGFEVVLLQATSNHACFLQETLQVTLPDHLLKCVCHSVSNMLSLLGCFCCCFCCCAAFAAVFSALHLLLLFCYCCCCAAAAFCCCAAAFAALLLLLLLLLLLCCCFCFCFCCFCCSAVDLPLLCFALCCCFCLLCCCFLFAAVLLLLPL